MEIRVLHRQSQSQSIRAITQQLGVPWNTVRRHLRGHSLAPCCSDRAPRATKLDAYKDYFLAGIEATRPH